MKHTMLALSVATIMAGTILTGCQSSATKVGNAEINLQTAKDNVVVAKHELNQAMKDSILQFRKESEDKIRTNETAIAGFKVKISKEKKENRARFEKKLARIEQQNNEMKQRLAEFNEDQRENWKSFEFKFKYDMDEFGRAMKDFWERN
jgi:septal ring factor EnvC (AmiA/AmiB activator)